MTLVKKFVAFERVPNSSVGRVAFLNFGEVNRAGVDTVSGNRLRHIGGSFVEKNNSLAGKLQPAAFSRQLLEGRRQKRLRDLLPKNWSRAAKLRTKFNSSGHVDLTPDEEIWLTRVPAILGLKVTVVESYPIQDFECNREFSSTDLSCRKTVLEFSAILFTLTCLGVGSYDLHQWDVGEGVSSPWRIGRLIRIR